MPRKRRTQSGDPAQRIESVPGQRYGEGVAQQEMQRQLPAPNRRAESTAVPAAAATPPAAPPRPRLEDVLGAAGGLSGGQGLLRSPSSRSNEPITAGLPMGPGPGPEILGGAVAETPSGRFLRDLAMRTGNRYFAELADRTGA